MKMESTAGRAAGFPGVAAFGQAVAYSNLWRRAKNWWHTANGAPEAPPAAFVGWQKIPLVGMFPRIKAIVTDPVGLVADCHAKYGDIFTIHIPLNDFDLTYLMDRDGYDYVLGLDPEQGRLGKVMLNVPTIGFWFPKSDESEPYLQALVLAGRTLIADLLRRRETNTEDIVRKVVARHVRHWPPHVDLGDALVDLIHEAAIESLVGEALSKRLRDEAFPALRIIANGIDVVRVSLAKTPYFHLMAERRATFKLYDVLKEVVEEHGQTGAYPIIDRIAAAQVDGKTLPAEDVPWMLMNVLWNAVTYPGGYGVWAFADILTHPDIRREITHEEASASPEARKRLLSVCLTETIRMSPVSSLPRWLSEPVEIDYQGKRYRIDKGNYLAACPYWHNNNPATYKDATTYNPKRYETEPAPSLFGRGAFGCVAQGFVYTLLSTVFDELLTNTQFEILGSLPARTVRVHLTYPSVPIPARVTMPESKTPSKERMEAVGQRIVAETVHALDVPFRNAIDEPLHVRWGEVQHGARLFHVQVDLPMDPLLALALIREGDLGTLAQAIEWRERRVDACEAVVRYTSELPAPWHHRHFHTHQLVGAVDGELYVLYRDVEFANTTEIEKFSPLPLLQHDTLRGQVFVSAYRLTPRAGGVRIRHTLHVSLGLRGMPHAALDAMMATTLRAQFSALSHVDANVKAACQSRMQHDPLYPGLEAALRAS